MNIYESFIERLTNKGMSNKDATIVINSMRNSVKAPVLWEKDKDVALKEYPAVLLVALWYRIQDEALEFIIENIPNAIFKSEFEKKERF